MPADGNTRVVLVAAPDTRLRVQVTGTGAPLLLLHGWTLDHRMWNRQVAGLADRYMCVVPDRRGWGGSTGTADLAREADDVIAILDHLDIARTALCAASQAGRVALRLALAHPERLSALILQGTALDGMPEPESDPGFVPVAEYARLVQAGNVAGFRRRWLAHVFMALPAGREELEREIAEMVEQSPLPDLRGDAAASESVDVTGRLGEISVPTLIITGGDETPHRRRIAATLLEKIPGARHVEIPGGGHLVNLTAPEAYNRALREFIG